MPIKSYEKFTLEQNESGQLIVRRNANELFRVAWLGSFFVTILCGILLYFTVHIAFAVFGGLAFMVFITVVILYIEEFVGWKKEFIIEKTNDNISLNGKMLLKISEIAYVELDEFEDSESIINNFRVSIIADRVGRIRSYKSAVT